MLNDFRPCGVTQLSLFDEGRSYANSDALMNVLDTINNSGKGKVWFAGRGIAPAWSMKRDMLSPAYTTRWGLDTDRYTLSYRNQEKNAFRLLVVDICSGVTIWV
uniref:Error-prone, lesion bypass DNA polymerase V (UmuC) n=1 Tax=Klebsiella pneumoniae TaxID=573 RepID=A0A8B0SVQ7_KLEPN|nr:Error-prone, lesion bypass DNA polymerase V (UmuC) [Klebsiella pneumoniae]